MNKLSNAVPSKVIAVLILSIFLSGCVQITLSWADLEGKGPVATPAILPQKPVNVTEWEEVLRPEIATQLEEQVYGHLPDRSRVEVTSRKVLDGNAFDGLGHLEEWKVTIGAAFGDAALEKASFKMVVLLPKAAKGPAPVLFFQSFCRSHVVVPHPNVWRPSESSFCDGDGFGMSIANYVFGRYNATPPVKEILEHGFALVSVFPSDVVPDSGSRGLAALERLAPNVEEETRWGAIAAWGWLYGQMAESLIGDPRFDERRFITYGHSRYGKASIVAAAFNPIFAGVVSHQSGTGGAALNKDKNGESVASITENYPHWFAKSYANNSDALDNMSVDQHHLLALVAPRPMLLGNARRDVWSDPASTLRAARAAHEVYELYGSKGLEQDRLDQFMPAADLTLTIRPGTHGTTEEDWPLFFEFLDAHFGDDKTAS